MACACDSCSVPQAQRRAAQLAELGPRTHEINQTLGANGRSSDTLSAPGPCSGWLIQVRTSAAAELRISAGVPSPGGAQRELGPIDLIPPQSGQGSATQAISMWVPYASCTLTWTTTPGATIQGRAVAMPLPPAPGDGLRYVYRSQKQTVASLGSTSWTAPSGVRAFRVLCADAPSATFLYRIQLEVQGVARQLWALARTGNTQDTQAAGPFWVRTVEGVTGVTVTNSDAAAAHDFTVEWELDLWA